MPTAFVCIALAFGLVYVPLLARAVWPASSWAKRAREAYAAAAVAFPGFAAAVFVAHIAGADERRMTVLAVAYVVTRALHLPAALLDLGLIRRALWAIALLLIFGLFALPTLTS
ncbi:MAG: MAPEG family protein [Nannocystaceae bacterium]|nr:MAPEG family protein [Nannocystaceae bacterium]